LCVINYKCKENSILMLVYKSREKVKGCGGSEIEPEKKTKQSQRENVIA
jgi:hypothetical protein